MEPTFRCSVCGATYHDPAWLRAGAATCPACGPWGILEVHLPLASPLPPPAAGMDRWRPLLPVPPRLPVPPVPVGDTPLVDAPRLADRLGLEALAVKDEGRNPSGSLKDRASWVAAALAAGRVAACASTGNAASSLALLCASLGAPAVIFVPEDVPPPKLAQLLVFGARVFRVRGGYEAAYALCGEAVEAFGWYDRSAAINPVMVEGKKTCGLELAEAGPVDWVAVSVGDGCTVAGIWKGLVEMHALGRLERLPRLLGVQARKAPAVYEAWRRGWDAGPAGPPPPAGAASRADSINVALPRNWRRAVAAIRASGGRMVLVDDDAIEAAMRLVARLAGVYAEPAGAAAVAGLAAAGVRGRAVAVATGSGLKDTAAALRAGGEAHLVDGLEAVRAAFQREEDG